jgi:hypothetical protein
MLLHVDGGVGGEERSSNGVTHGAR